MQFTVDPNVCTRCGLCVAECPTGFLYMTEDGPVPGKSVCIACGHCISICPTKTLDSDITPRSEQVDITGEPAFTPEEGERFLRQRRSVRTYQDKEVPKEVIERLLNVARMAPTATNTQGISYIVVREKETLKQISELVFEWMKEAAKTRPLMRLYLRTATAEIEKGNDYYLRNTPCLVVAVGSSRDEHRTHDSGHSCLTYAELYAPTLGLGSCWVGFFEYAIADRYQPLLDLLGIGKKEMGAGAILLGYPKYKYRNIVERAPLAVRFHEEG